MGRLGKPGRPSSVLPSYSPVTAAPPLVLDGNFFPAALNRTRLAQSLKDVPASTAAARRMSSSSMLTDTDRAWRRVLSLGTR